MQCRFLRKVEALSEYQQLRMVYRSVVFPDERQHCGEKLVMPYLLQGGVKKNRLCVRHLKCPFSEIKVVRIPSLPSASPTPPPPRRLWRDGGGICGQR